MDHDEEPPAPQDDEFDDVVSAAEDVPPTDEYRLSSR